MSDEERQLWHNFSDALQRLLEHPELTPAQRDFILHNVETEEKPKSNVIDIRRKRESEEE